MIPIIPILARKLTLPSFLFVMGVAVGGWGVYKLYHLGEVRALKNAIEEQAEQHKEELDLLAVHHKNALKIEGDKVIIKEITRYVKDNRECDINPTAAGLLERARKGVPAAATGTTGNTGPVAKPLGISQGVELQAHVDCGIRYRQLSEQLTALIKWHHQVKDK